MIVVLLILLQSVDGDKMDMKREDGAALAASEVAAIRTGWFAAELF